MSFATRLAETDAQEEAIRKVEGWVKKTLGRNIVDGTTIGKHPQGVILDLTYHGGEIYVNANGFEDTDHGYPGCTVCGEQVRTFSDFKRAIKDFK